MRSSFLEVSQPKLSGSKIVQSQGLWISGVSAASKPNEISDPRSSLQYCEEQFRVPL